MMRLLTDQDIYQVTVTQLMEWGHDVITAREIGMQRASDEDLLTKARELERLFITRDKDFGTLVFLREELSMGVILLRITPQTVEDIHRELLRLLDEHTEEELRHLFCVVEHYRHRIRRLK